VNYYYRKMKGMTDALHDLDEPGTNYTIVLNILWGLNKPYVHLKTFLKQVVSFTSFHDIYNHTAFTASGERQSWCPPFPAPFEGPLVVRWRMG
jgi:hypothetical protein